jgi:ABC-2 type transport system ATP-binding protein
MPEPRHAVEVEHLSKHFGDFKAVDDVSFTVAPGEVFGFLGPNGAGKSTTMKMLTGILAPTAGAGRVAGFDVTQDPHAVRSNIGYMSQKFSLYMDLTVRENLDFFAGIYIADRKLLKERKQWALAAVDLESQIETLTESMPMGWRQKLALACAIVHRPPILFLDEPTSGVDPASRRNFWDIIYRLSKDGVTVFVSTHYMDEAEHCDRLAFIYGGKLVAMGTPMTLKREQMTETLLEVRVPDPLAAMEIVRRVPGVHDVSLYGSALHLTTHVSAADMQPRLAAALAAAGVAVAGIEPAEPTLEDVFLSLMSKEAP